MVDPIERKPMSRSMIVKIDPVPQGRGVSLNTPDIPLHLQQEGVTLRLELEFWQALEEICRREQRSVDAVCSAVYMTRATDLPLELAMRLFIFDYFRCAATEEGHSRADHGADLAAHEGCGRTAH
jgi:predicted DNA-binding ribbon-helix-helix protein